MRSRLKWNLLAEHYCYIGQVQLCEYGNQTLEAFVAASMPSLIVQWPARIFHF